MLELREISKSYKKELFSNLNYKFYDGIYFVKGPSGCGKSTLLDIIKGLINPDSGEVLLNGKPIKESEANNLFTYFKAENVLMSKDSLVKNKNNIIKNTNISFNNKRFNELINKFDFQRLAQIKLYKLSGGERKLANLIFILSIDTYFYLFDEPFSEIDTKNRLILKKTILSLKTNKCVIITNHQEKDVSFEYDGIIDLENKIVVESKNTKDSFKELKDKIRTKTNVFFKFKMALLLFKENLTLNLVSILVFIISLVSLATGFEYLYRFNENTFDFALKNEPSIYEYYNMSNYSMDLETLDNDKDIDSVKVYDSRDSIFYNSSNNFYVVALKEITDNKIHVNSLKNDYVLDSFPYEVVNEQNPIINNNKIVDLVNNSHSDFSNVLSSTYDYFYVSFSVFDSLIFDNKINDVYVSDGVSLNKLRNEKLSVFFNVLERNNSSISYLNGAKISLVEGKNIFSVPGLNMDKEVWIQYFDGARNFYTTTTIDGKAKNNDGSDVIEISKDIYINMLFSMKCIKYEINKSDVSKVINKYYLTLNNSILYKVYSQKDMIDKFNNIGLILVVGGIVLSLLTIAYALYIIFIKRIKKTTINFLEINGCRKKDTHILMISNQIVTGIISFIIGISLSYLVIYLLNINMYNLYVLKYYLGANTPYASMSAPSYFSYNIYVPIIITSVFMLYEIMVIIFNKVKESKNA